MLRSTRSLLSLACCFGGNTLECGVQWYAPMNNRPVVLLHRMNGRCTSTASSPGPPKLPWHLLNAATWYEGCAATWYEGCALLHGMRATWYGLYAATWYEGCAAHARSSQGRHAGISPGKGITNYQRVPIRHLQHTVEWVGISSYCYHVGTSSSYCS